MQILTPALKLTSQPDKSVCSAVQPFALYIVQAVMYCTRCKATWECPSTRMDCAMLDSNVLPRSPTPPPLILFKVMHVAGRECRLAN